MEEVAQHDPTYLIIFYLFLYKFIKFFFIYIIIFYIYIYNKFNKIKIKYLHTGAGVGFTGQIGEFLGEFDFPSLLSLVLIYEPAAACAISLFLLKRERNISNSRCRSK